MNLHRLLRHLHPEPVHVSRSERWRTAVGAFLGMLVVTAVSSTLMPPTALPLVAASMGASAVLLFALPNSPLAQPWPFVGSHLISAGIGVSCALWIPDMTLGAAVAVGLAIFVMHNTHTIHPPGGASALLPVVIGEPAREAGFQFIVTPVAINVGLMLVMALIVNNLVMRRRWPMKPYLDEQDADEQAQQAVSGRAGITHQDLHRALAELDVYLDVSEEDLQRIYRAAGVHAYRRRMGEITCEDIMARNPVTARPDTDLEAAWALLSHHRVKALPVVDDRRRVVGIVTLVDVLRRVDLKRYRGVDERLLRFIRRTLRLAGQPPRRVGEIMARPVLTVDHDMHIADVVPLLSDAGYHHLPVVDRDYRLVGMLNQSELIAALYADALTPVVETYSAA